MRHAGVGSEYVADAVARAVRHSGYAGDLREPRRELAFEARLEIVGARLDRRQVGSKHPHRVQREAVGERMRPDRAPALDRVIHRAHSGRQHQFQWRLARRRRIEYHCDGGHQRMVDRELDLALHIGDPCDAAEFGGGQRRRHRRHAHPVGGERRERRRTALRRERRQRVDVAHSAPQREQHGFGRIDHRAPADCEQMVRFDLARSRGAGDHGFTRRVGADRVKPSDAAIAQSRGHLPDKAALRERPRGGEQHALRADALDLRRDGFRRGLAVYHALLRYPLHRAGQHARSSIRIPPREA